jgi:hypothetical protein
MVFVPV